MSYASFKPLEQNYTSLENNKEHFESRNLNYTPIYYAEHFGNIIEHAENKPEEDTSNKEEETKTMEDKLNELTSKVNTITSQQSQLNMPNMKMMYPVQIAKKSISIFGAIMGFITNSFGFFMLFILGLTVYRNRKLLLGGVSSVSQPPAVSSEAPPMEEAPMEEAPME